MPIAYFKVVATAKVAGGQFQMRHAPQDWIVRREVAQQIADAARDFAGPLKAAQLSSRRGANETRAQRRPRIALPKIVAGLQMGQSFSAIPCARSAGDPKRRERAASTTRGCGLLYPATLFPMLPKA